MHDNDNLLPQNVKPHIHHILITVLIFVEGGKPESLEKNLCGMRERTNTSNKLCSHVTPIRESYPGDNGESSALSPLGVVLLRFIKILSC